MLSNLSGAMNGRAIIRQTRAIRRLCHSLPQLAKVAADQKSRALLREMASEWLKLAEDAGESNGTSDRD